MKPARKQPRPLRDAPSIVVGALSAAHRVGHVRIGGLCFPCTLGRTGRRAIKREGDGATPIGAWAMREVFYRRDRGFPPSTRLPVRAIRADAGWCDDVRDPNYNRRIRHPYRASAEHLARDDALYDLVVVLGYNDVPRVKGKGSAIFMHLARPDRGPTAGCVALSRRDLELVLARIRRGTRLIAPA